jgi:release factor glutamine methyltransferase
MIYPVSEDTLLLLESAEEEIRQEDVVLEVGSGSGYVAEKLKGRCRIVIASDISPFAVGVMREKGLESIRADLLTCFKRRFSLILFNPPYLELEEFERKGDWIERAIDGGRKGIEVMKRFLEQLNSALRDDGRAILIISSVNTPDIYEIIQKSGFRYRILKKKKLFFEMIYAIKIERN